MELNPRNCWTLAEALGHSGPNRLQRFLAHGMWDHDLARDRLMTWTAGQLADGQAVLIANETGDEKSSTEAVDASALHSGALAASACARSPSISPGPPRTRQAPPATAPSVARTVLPRPDRDPGRLLHRSVWRRRHSTKPPEPAEPTTVGTTSPSPRLPGQQRCPTDQELQLPCPIRTPASSARGSGRLIGNELGILLTFRRHIDHPLTPGLLSSKNFREVPPNRSRALMRDLFRNLDGTFVSSLILQEFPFASPKGTACNPMKTFKSPSPVPRSVRITRPTTAPAAKAAETKTPVARGL